MTSESSKWTLNKNDLIKWKANLLIFLAPVLIVYFTSVIDVMSKTGVFNWKDFIPTAITIGAMVLYLLNGAVDILRKLSAGK